MDKPVMVPATPALYDKHAENFARFAEHSYTWDAIEAPVFDRHLAEFRGPVRTLDLGCGTGRLTAFLVRLGLDPRLITGVDESERMLDFARTRVREATFLKQDLLQLDLPTKDFQLATAHMVFEAFSNANLPEVLKRTFDHLAVGGCLFFVTTHPLRHFRESETYLRRDWVRVATPWGLELSDFFRPVSDFINLTIDAGFRIEAVDEIGIERAAYANEYALERYGKCPAIRLAIKARK